MYAALALTAALASPSIDVPRPPVAVELDGARVAWVAPVGHHLTAFSRRVAGGRTLRRRLTGTTRDVEDGVAMYDFAMRSGRFAYAVTVSDRFANYPAVYLGAFGAAPQQIAECTDDAGSPGIGPLSVALTADAFAYAFCQKVPYRYKPVDLRDAAGARQLAPVGDDVEAAGPYVAWRAPEALFVYDRVAGRQALRVDQPVARYALGEDGTVLLASDAGELATASPSQPVPRPIGVRSRGLLRLAGGRALAYERRRLRLISLDGRVRTLARFRRGPYVVAFGWDGRLAAWAERSRVRVMRVGAA